MAGPPRDIDIDLASGIDPLGAALAAACGDADVLARLGGPLGASARAMRARQPDRGTRARWAAAVRAPIPSGLRGVHPSWIEAALAELPPRARVAVAAGAGDAVDTWLARWATAAFPPMFPVTAARVTSLDAAARVDAAALARWLEDTGADQLALALGAAGLDAVASVAQIADGAGGAGDRVRLAQARITVAPRAGALGPVRAAIARCRIALDDRALLRIGARAIAPHTDPVLRRRLACRLPRPLGLIVAAELAAAATAPLDQAPRLAALFA